MEAAFSGRFFLFFGFFLRGFALPCFLGFGFLGLVGWFIFVLTILPQQFSCHFYKFLPTVELSSSTTSTFLSLYSTLKSSMRGCLSTICLDGTTWRNAEDEEGVEEAAVE